MLTIAFGGPLQYARAMDSTLSGFALFKRFADIWQTVLPTVSVRRFPKDTVICEHGEPAPTLWLVTDGWVTLSRHTPDGREVTVGLCSRGDLFGEAGLFMHAHYPYNARIIQPDTELACIPAATMRQLASEHPAFSEYLMQMLGDRIHSTQIKLEQQSVLSAAQRLGCFLLRLCNDHAGPDYRLSMPVEKHIIASYLGMKPETLSRSFQQLSAVGIHVAQADVTVGDVAQLRDFVCSSCSESGMCATEGELMGATGSGQR